MLAGDEPALAVAGVAVGEVGGFSVDRDCAALLFPFDDALVRDVAAQEIAPVADPHRAFGPAQSGGETLDGRRLEPVAFEAGIEGAYCRIGIRTCWAPA